MARTKKEAARSLTRPKQRAEPMQDVVASTTALVQEVVNEMDDDAVQVVAEMHSATINRVKHPGRREAKAMLSIHKKWGKFTKTKPGTNKTRADDLLCAARAQACQARP